MKLTKQTIVGFTTTTIIIILTTATSTSTTARTTTATSTSTTARTTTATTAATTSTTAFSIGRCADYSTTTGNKPKVRRRHEFHCLTFREKKI